MNKTLSSEVVICCYPEFNPKLIVGAPFAIHLSEKHMEVLMSYSYECDDDGVDNFLEQPADELLRQLTAEDPKRVERVYFEHFMIRKDQIGAISFNYCDKMQQYRIEVDNLICARIYISYDAGKKLYKELMNWWAEL